MKPALIFAAFLSGLSVSCASTPSMLVRPGACQAPGQTGEVVTGMIVIDHGDRLITAGSEEADSLFLVRDDIFLKNIDRLDGSVVTLLVEPVPACSADQGSSMTACIYLGEEGTAYRILDYCAISKP